MPHVETFIDGVWYPSVSTIIGAKPAPWLDAWREKWGELATRKMEIAAAIGTAFHDCIEQYFDRGYYAANIPKHRSCERRVHDMMRSWVVWATSVDGIIDHTEMKVVSKAHTYSGTFDWVGKISKKHVLGDWKTGSRIYPEMDLQLVAYAEAFNEMTGSKIKDGLIVHVSKDRPHKVTVKEFKLGKRVFKKFLKLREMFDEVQKEAQGE